jgi:two-component system, NarL family, invasion response regulator UvrY
MDFSVKLHATIHTTLLNSMNAQPPLRTFLIADDHPIVRRGMYDFLMKFRLADHVLEASNGKEVLGLDKMHSIDLFILDFKMPELDGYEVSKQLLNSSPSCKIIINTMFTELTLIDKLYELGVKAVLSKAFDIEEIENAIERVLSGNTYYSVDYNKQMAVVRASKEISFGSQIKTMVSLIANGKTSKEIALTLGLSPKTIETYRSRLFIKTGTSNTAELVDYFYKTGIL